MCNGKISSKTTFFAKRFFKFGKKFWIWQYHKISKYYNYYIYCAQRKMKIKSKIKTFFQEHFWFHTFSPSCLPEYRCSCSRKKIVFFQIFFLNLKKTECRTKKFNLIWFDNRKPLISKCQKKLIFLLSLDITFNF